MRVWFRIVCEERGEMGCLDKEFVFRYDGYVERARARVVYGERMFGLLREEMWNGLCLEWNLYFDNACERTVVCMISVSILFGFCIIILGKVWNVER